MKSYTYKQFLIFKILLAVFFCYHFSTLMPYAAELFSTSGWQPQFRRSFINFSSSASAAFLVTLIIASILLPFQKTQRWAALYLWLGIVILLSINALYYDINLDYFGWLLLMIALVPTVDEKDWQMPKILFEGAWLVLGVGYFASAIGKLLFPVWQNGDAVRILFDSMVINRFIFSAEFLKNYSWIFKILTWLVVLSELLFLPLSLFKRSRFFAWLSMTLIHIAICASTQLSEISVAALIFHFYIFDSSWPTSLKKK